jgi:hypothetical protein
MSFGSPSDPVINEAMAASGELGAVGVVAAGVLLDVVVVLAAGVVEEVELVSGVTVEEALVFVLVDADDAFLALTFTSQLVTHAANPARPAATKKMRNFIFRLQIIRGAL